MDFIIGYLGKMDLKLLHVFLTKRVDWSSKLSHIEKQVGEK